MLPITVSPSTRTLLALGLGLTLFSAAASVTAQEATPTPTTLVEAVRQATTPFPDPVSAEAAGYVPMNGCVSSPQDGAMGMHYINGELVGDGELDAAQPEALIYALQDGDVGFVGVEYLVLAEDWDAAQDGPPILMGQLFNFVGAPNRYRNPAFYELHVWAGQDNPHGLFADWNPTVSCADVPGANGSPSAKKAAGANSFSTALPSGVHGELHPKPERRPVS